AGAPRTRPPSRRSEARLLRCRRATGTRRRVRDRRRSRPPDRPCLPRRDPSTTPFPSRDVPPLGDTRNGSRAYTEGGAPGPTIRGMARGRSGGDTRTLPDPITVIIADDHRSFGEALQIALDKERDLSVVRVVDGGDDAVRTT